MERARDALPGVVGRQGGVQLRGAIEDGDAEFAFVTDPANAKTYRIDTSRIVVIGHSMGGLIAAATAAHHPQVRAAVLLSAWNIGAPRSDEAAEAKALASGENLAPIAGTDGPTLAHEEFTYRAELDLQGFAKSLASRPVMLVTANDFSDQFATPFVAALRADGDKQIKEVHFGTDHSYSADRLELADAVIALLQPIAEK